MNTLIMKEITQTGSNDGGLTFYTQRVKGQLPSDILMFFPGHYSTCNSGTEEKIMTIFYIWSENESLTLIFGG